MFPIKIKDNSKFGIVEGCADSSIKKLLEIKNLAEKRPWEDYEKIERDIVKQIYSEVGGAEFFKEPITFKELKSKLFPAGKAKPKKSERKLKGLVRFLLNAGIIEIRK